MKIGHFFVDIPEKHAILYMDIGNFTVCPSFAEEREHGKSR